MFNTANYSQSWITTRISPWILAVIAAIVAFFWIAGMTTNLFNPPL